MAATEVPLYDAIVLSGGGAKGAYGAGAAKALWEFRRLKEIDRPLCFFGASAGALNAAVLATEGADALIQLWRSMTNRQVLGVVFKSAKYQGTKNWFRRVIRRSQPYYVYSGRALLELIRRNISFSKLAESHHLVVAATNYTSGTLKAFFHSAVLKQSVAEDNTRPAAMRRLGHFEPITEENFHACLLASASIPIFFPPVQISNSWYIDGGVGNNTPTREAAYFMRFLKQQVVGEAGDVYCVKLEPPSLRIEGPIENTPLGILDRTLSIYHYIHTTPIIDAWFRINREVETYDQRISAFLDWIRSQGWDKTVVASLIGRVDDTLRHLGGPAPRIDIPLHLIEPSAPLGETLNFDPATIERSIKTGYLDMLRVLNSAAKLDQAETKELQNAPIFAEK